ncbi:DUF6152 family protein [Arenicella sp.]|nr:DUF6152 family protein [Arenicella sp.]
MNARLPILAVWLLCLLFASLASFAHHSDVGIDESRTVELRGTVTEFRWRMPHVYLDMEVIENGQPTAWNIQLVGINILTRQGWKKDSLTPGEEIIVQAYPGDNGRTHGKLISMTFADGSPVALDPEAPEVVLTPNDSMDGKWSGRNPVEASNNNEAPPPPPLVDQEHESEDKSCSGGFDCFFIQNLVLTDAAKQARAEYDPLSTENPETTCVGRPTPAALVSARGYLQEWDLSQQEEKIIIHSEWFNEKRTVWMDGRGHPDPSETIATGHSIGKWEGDTLVVDTANFDYHRSPYQIGVPSSTQKHVVERYTLIDDGRKMEAEFTLEDPVYLAEPLVKSNLLYNSPDMQMHTADCDPANTSQFIK